MGEFVRAWFRVRTWLTLVPFAFFTGSVASARAADQEYPMQDVGGWTVAASKDKKGCFVTRTYDGPGRTTLLFGLDVDGSNRLSVLNDNWSIEEKDRVKLTFQLSGGEYSGHSAVGISSHGKNGFVTSFEAKFPTYFAASRALEIYRGDVPVEKLSLDGSGAAVAELRRCVGIFRTETPPLDARETSRSDGIPKDPFASDASKARGSKSKR